MNHQKGKVRLGRVLKRSGDLIGSKDVINALDVDAQRANQMLARWTQQGYLRRISRGVYARASLEAIESEYILDDPWVIVPALFAPCYIASRTASEFWDLTEQLFRDIVVFTSTKQRKTRVNKHGTAFTLKKVSNGYLYGTSTVWRGKTKVQVADVHKTVIDLIAFPDVGGGIQQVADCLCSYYQRDDCNPRLLLDYASRAANGAIFKRLGFLLEKYQLDALLAEACRANLTTGLAELDPDVEGVRIVSRWQLRVPRSWAS
ncbi:MAG: hypothetical protein O2780_18415 [Proteobacteria bacterium]|nr:hypothetical protein [Pseudomonadota bacterium]MDA1302536.1 hypothetical protein [Pseudomonadota bacterium]